MAPMPNQYTTPIPPPERFWPKVRFTDTCWLWNGAQDWGGYGKFGEGRQAGNRVVMAQRYAYEFCMGQLIPDGLTIDHLCRVRHCVNPDHLEPVTMRVNILRGVSPSAKNARKTHCPGGHFYGEENTYIVPGGSKRHCYTCLRVANRLASRARTLQRGT